MVLDILLYDHPILRQKSAPVTDFGQNLKDLAKNLIDTLEHVGGLGLAAPQIGVLLQVFIIDLRNSGPNLDFLYDGKRASLHLFNPLVIINPVLEILPSTETTYAEGCLSLPDLRVNITRPTHAKITFLDLNQKSHTLECKGYDGHCLQHEIDHLNGILFIDRAQPKELDKVKAKLKQLKRATKDSLKKQSIN